MAVDIYIDQGADFFLTITVRDSDDDLVDLTGCTGVFRLSPGDFTSDILTYTGAPNLVIGGTDGQIRLRIPAVDTTALEITRGLWDIEVTFPFPDVSTLRVVSGMAILNRQPGNT